MPPAAPRPTLRPPSAGDCAANLLAAYRDFATLEEHCARRGVEALEADLLFALALAEHDPALQSPIFHLLRMLQRESHTLRGWDATTQPDYFAQQWLKRALIEEDAAMQQQARRGAKAAPHADHELADRVRIASPGAHPDRGWFMGERGGGDAGRPPGGRPGPQDNTLKVWELRRGGAAHPEGHARRGHRGGGNAGRAACGLGVGCSTLKVWDLPTGPVHARERAYRMGDRGGGNAGRPPGGLGVE